MMRPVVATIPRLQAKLQVTHPSKKGAAVELSRHAGNNSIAPVECPRKMLAGGKPGARRRSRDLRSIFLPEPAAARIGQQRHPMALTSTSIFPYFFRTALAIFG
jgi:hypothetical protein